MLWTKKSPTEEGWYFWKRAKSSNDIRWESFYVEVLENKDEYEYWTCQTACDLPRGGWWAGPIGGMDSYM